MGRCSSTTRWLDCSNTRPTTSSRFIGADRGFRALQFFSGSGLVLQPLSTVTEDRIDALHLAEGEWLLVVRDDGTPFGWIDGDGVAAHRDGGALYDSVTAGGSLYRPEGTLRTALDAALSPVGYRCGGG